MPYHTLISITKCCSPALAIQDRVCEGFANVWEISAVIDTSLSKREQLVY